MNLEYINSKLQNQDIPTRKNEQWKYSPMAKWLKSQESALKTHFDALEKPLDYYAKITQDGLKEKKLPNISMQELKGSQDLCLSQERTSDPFYTLHQNSPFQSFQFQFSKDSKTELLLDIECLNSSLFFQIEEGAKLDLYLRFIGSEQEEHFQINSTFFELSKNSQVNCTRVNLCSERTRLLSYNSVKLLKAAQFKNSHFSFGSLFERAENTIELSQDSSHVELNALYPLDHEQHIDHQVLVHHLSPNTTSRQLFKGILAQKSLGAFTGKVFIHKDAQRVNAAQLNKNLVLSDQAQAHSCPQLEIFADDVKCSHGSTTGQLNQEELFYLQSRGLSLKKAQEILSIAFGKEVVMNINNIKIKDDVLAHFNHKIANLSGVSQ